MLALPNPTQSTHIFEPKIKVSIGRPGFMISL